MSFNRNRGGGGGGFRGNGRGGGGGRGGFNKSSGFNRSQRSGGGRNNFEQGPPERVVPLGHFNYVCQNDLVCKVDINDVPYFNAPVYMENKEQIGKVDEIFGTVRDYSISIKMSDNIYANSFKPNQKVFIDPGKLLPISRFLPKPPQPKGQKKMGTSCGGIGKNFNRGGGSRGGRGNRGGYSQFSKGGGGSRGGNFGKGRGSGRNRW